MAASRAAILAAVGDVGGGGDASAVAGGWVGGGAEGVGCGVDGDATATAVDGGLALGAAVELGEHATTPSTRNKEMIRLHVRTTTTSDTGLVATRMKRVTGRVTS